MTGHLFPRPRADSVGRSSLRPTSYAGDGRLQFLPLPAPRTSSPLVAGPQPVSTPALDVTWSADSHGHTVVSVAGDVTHGNAWQFKRQLQWLLLAQPPVLLLRLNNARFLGSFGVECLAAAYRWAGQLGVDMRVAAPASGAGRLLHLTDPGDPLLP
ncbi:STAS domain-containing protein [Actinopolymorpha rutila]|uniref:STAS domain-containing protein n=1 Tax=Actinopolymorpha rutila TaxID=446787 RepID=UPI0015CD299F|nr:STAS domain-containing protein [Actinopolymorpha rutila]